MEHEVGLLFVHGIGEQGRGDTVISFGEPVICWLDEWLRGQQRGSARFRDAELRPARLLDDEPAAATAVIERKSDSGSSVSTWLLAESWWAVDFRRPPFTKVAGWLLSTGFWTVLSHAGRSVFTRKRRWWLRPIDVLKIVAAIPGGWLLQIGVVLLSLLAWVPIPKLRRALSAVLLRVSGTLGDSYVLLESPMQKAAAVAVTRRNIQRMTERCRQVVVVAHSQGAALAHMALRNGAPEQVKLLVTVGSGLSKLHEMEAHDTRRLMPMLRTMATISLLMMLMLPRVFQTWKSSSGDVLWYYGLFPVLLLAGVLFSAWDHWKRLSRDLPPSLSLKPVKWWDVYASADPVPNGPLAAPGVAIECFESQAVTNRMSLFSDHSTYWTNRDEFLPALLARIDAALDCGMFAETDRTRLAAAARGRRPRVRMLVAVRLACLGSIALVLWAMRARLSGQGAGMLAALNDVPLSRPIADLVVSAGLIVKGMAAFVATRDQAWLAPVGYAVVAASVPVLAVGLWYRFVAFPIWAAWDARQGQWLCNPNLRPEKRADRAALPVTAMALGLAPAALAIAALWRPDYGRLGLLALDSVVSIPALLVTLGLLYAIVGSAVSIALLLWKGIRWAVRAIRRGARAPDGAGSRAAGA